MPAMTTLRKVLLYVFLTVIGLPLLALLLLLFVLVWFDESNGSLVSSGQQREYLIHVPPNYTGSEPVPLVISLHVAFLMPSSQQRYSGWSEVADEHGILVVYPAGTGFPKLWRGIAPGANRQTETRFFHDLIDHLMDNYAIDPARIYITGYSNGAAMAAIVACELDDRIAAAGVVAIPVPNMEWCERDRPVPLAIFQGMLDAFAPYDGGDHALADAPMPGVPDWTAQWARGNGCRTTPVESAVADDVILTRYTACEDSAEVLLYTVTDGGHTWPGVPRMPEAGVGKTTESIHASEVMWSFFETHQR